jgi:hypothetical protein
LVRSPLGESNDKNTQEVSVGSFDIGMCFDESLPLTDKGLEFVASERHSREIGKTIFPLNFVYTEFDFAKGVFFVFL